MVSDAETRYSLIHPHGHECLLPLFFLKELKVVVAEYCSPYAASQSGPSRGIAGRSLWDAEGSLTLPKHAFVVTPSLKPFAGSLCTLFASRRAGQLFPLVHNCVAA